MHHVSAAKKKHKKKLLSVLFFFEGKNFNNGVKRCFDIFFSLFSLLFFLPLFALIALLIKTTSKGPIIFTQDRLGRSNTIFKCYKFRTMYEDAEERLQEILNKNSVYKKEWEIHQKLKQDPRITLIGKFLRKSSFDEFPQFLNVLKGDLSVVGPRPYMVFQRKDLGEKEKEILSIRPGITGLWQTSGRSTLSFQKRVELDAYYVEKHTMLYDLRLIIKTVPALFCDKNAY